MRASSSAPPAAAMSRADALMTTKRETVPRERDHAPERAGRRAILDDGGSPSADVLEPACGVCVVSCESGTRQTPPTARNGLFTNKSNPIAARVGGGGEERRGGWTSSDAGTGGDHGGCVLHFPRVRLAGRWPGARLSGAAPRARGGGGGTSRFFLVCCFVLENACGS